MKSGKNTASKPPKMPSPNKDIAGVRLNGSDAVGGVPPVLHLSELQLDQEAPDSGRGQRELSPTLERSPLFNSDHCERIVKEGSGQWDKNSTLWHSKGSETSSGDEEDQDLSSSLELSDCRAD